MDEQFKTGDRVQLKSGGPQMMVDQVGPGTLGGTKLRVWCEWFDGDKKVAGNFAPENLRAGSQKRVDRLLK